MDIFEKNIGVYTELGCKDRDITTWGSNHSFCQLMGNYRMDMIMV